MVDYAAGILTLNIDRIGSARPIRYSDIDRAYVNSGTRRMWLRGALIGAAPFAIVSVVGAVIGSVFIPGIGTVLGGAVGLYHSARISLFTVPVGLAIGYFIKKEKWQPVSLLGDASIIKPVIRWGFSSLTSGGVSLTLSLKSCRWPQSKVTLIRMGMMTPI